MTDPNIQVTFEIDGDTFVYETDGNDTMSDQVDDVAEEVSGFLEAVPYEDGGSQITIDVDSEWTL